MDAKSRCETLEMISKVLEKHQWLLNAFNMDYYENNHWDRMPKSWKNCLENIRQKDIPQLLCSDKPPKHVFPLALLSLRSISFEMRKPRKMTKESSLPFRSEEKESASHLALSFSPEHQFPVKPLKVSDNILCRRIKLKKRHEIERLCKVIPPLMKTVNDCKEIIDCGSGQGHLDRILSIVYGYKVFSIESNCDNVNGAFETDEIVRKALAKCKISNLSTESMPTKVNTFLSERDDIATQVKGQENVSRQHLLLGLHACGPLSNLIIEQFVNDPAASALVLACCCYMKTGTDKFPMSQFLQKKVHFTLLSREGKELACHAIEKFIIKFEKNEMNSLKVHGYRSILEMLVSKFDPEKRHKGMRAVKIDSDMTFQAYAQKATRNMHVNIPDEIYSDSVLVKPCLEQLERAVIFYSLRLLVAPLVEMFILLDFEQYLCEHPQVTATYLVPLFDPTLSPRNLILLAHK